jgi:hypothetical protein
MEELPMAQILKVAPLHGTNIAALERTLKEKVLPHVNILHRTVAATSHRLFLLKARDPEAAAYMWLVFTKLVGSTPETAGQGPVVLCEQPLPIDKIVKQLEGIASVTTLDEIEP